MPFCHFEKTSKKPVSKAYPKELVTIGDHIRKRRLDLRLTQKRVAAILGVNECTVWNWENNRTKPLPSLKARIGEFLGCLPESGGMPCLGHEEFNGACVCNLKLFDIG